MRRKLVQSSLRGLSLMQVRHVTPVGFDAAQGTVARVYRELERDFGVLAPPIALHSPAPRLLSGSWLMLRETLLVPGLASRAAKEAVAAAVSAGNECPFCVRMHVSTLRGLVHGRDAMAVEEGRIDSVSDPQVRAIASWTKANAVRNTPAPVGAPFPLERAPELVGVAVTLQYLNRMVNIFLGDKPLPPGAPDRSLGAVLGVLSWLIRSAARSVGEPGVSLDLLPAAPLPEDLSWAADSPVVAEAFAKAAHAADEAAERSVPDSVRALLRIELARWDGRPRGISRAWAEDAVTALPTADRPAGYLALLAAFASYQVDETVVARFRERRPEDGALVDLTSWASLAAARKTGEWMRNSLGA